MMIMHEGSSWNRRIRPSRVKGSESSPEGAALYKLTGLNRPIKDPAFFDTHQERMIRYLPTFMLAQLPFHFLALAAGWQLHIVYKTLIIKRPYDQSNEQNLTLTNDYGKMYIILDARRPCVH